MAEPLTKEEIEMYENFISNKTPIRNRDFCIPYYGILEGRKIYAEIKKSKEPQYVVFHSESMGLTGYAIYKSPNNKIYMINSYNNVPQMYSICRG